MYNARVPFSLGTAGDRRGADMKFLYDHLDNPSTILWNALALVLALPFLRIVVVQVYKILFEPER